MLFLLLFSAAELSVEMGMLVFKTVTTACSKEEMTVEKQGVAERTRFGS